MRASEVMVPNPFVAVANASASEVAIMFRSRNISVVPVVDDHRTPPRRPERSGSGDPLSRGGNDPLYTRADALMRTDSCVVNPDQDLEASS
jgi:CBS domain-containing protein